MASVSRNSVWIVSVNIFVRVTQLLTIRFIYGWLGESSYSIYVLVMAFVGYATLLEPSVLYGVQKRLVERYLANDHEGAQRVQEAQATIVLVTTGFGTAALLALGLFYQIPGATVSRGGTWALFAAGAIIFVSAQVNQLLVPILSAREMFRSLSLRQASETVASAVVGMALAYWFRSPLGVLIGTAGGSMVSVVVNICSLKRAGHPYHIVPRRHRAELKDLLNYARLGYPHRIFGGASNSADRVLYSYSGRPLEDISRYAIAYRVPESMQMIFVFAADALVPRLTRDLNDSPEAAANALDKLGRLMLATGVAFVLVPGCFGSALLRVWLGNVPRAAPEAMAFLSAYFALQMYMAAMTKIFYASGRLHRAAVFTGYNAALTLALTIPMARWGGIVGVALMNAGIALTQFIPYAFWIKRDCVPSFDALRHTRATSIILLIGSLVGYGSYQLCDLTYVADRPLLGIFLALVAALITGAIILGLRLAEIPPGIANRIGRWKVRSDEPRLR